VCEWSYAEQRFAYLTNAYRTLDDNPIKITLNVDDELLAGAKSLAVRQHLTLTRLIEEGLRMRLQATVSGTTKNRRAVPLVDR
jgi:hypothetical protein